MTFDIGHNGNPKKYIFLNVYRIIHFFEKLNNKKKFWPIISNWSQWKSDFFFFFLKKNVFRIIGFFEKLNKKKKFWPIFTKENT